MLIDAHQHFWQLDRGLNDWPTSALPALYRDFLPEDLKPLLQGEGIEATVLVQAAASEAETRFMLDLAKEHPFILGVVGWFPMEAEDAAERLDRLIDYGGGMLKGVRAMIQDEASPEWILSRRLDSAFDALVDRNLTLDALVLAHQLEPTLRRVKRHPGLKTVIDHGGKPAIAAGESAVWRSLMQSFATETRALCKFSGLFTQAGDDWQPEQIEPYAKDLLDLFGPARVMWGSDWPVLNLASNYAAWLDFSLAVCGGLPEEDQAKIFGETAATFYGLKESGCQ